MRIVNNSITPLQWELILDAFHTHCKEHGAKEDEPLIIDEFTSNASGDHTKRKQAIFDNYDRFSSPGLTFLLMDQMSTGALFVYSSSEQANAPITFEEGMQIAQTFFTYEATELSEHIVCNHVMNRV
tara:strand:- start:62 stop:442 length:381 start_codon:yes stop_codon:yes gene_type:complete